MHTRTQIGSWEIQAERVQNEKAVYWYDDSKVAMGRYAIVFVLAKNLASGTQSIYSSLAPALRDDKGRIYDFSDPLTTERWAMIAAMWEFSVGKSVFDDINPGVETPLLMLWDVNEDVQSLTLIMTDGRNRFEWDLGNFSATPLQTTVKEELMQIPRKLVVCALVVMALTSCGPAAPLIRKALPNMLRPPSLPCRRPLLRRRRACE